MRDSLEREDRYLLRGEIWCFRINRLFVRDGHVGGNLARFINHACWPNCYAAVVVDTIWIVAARSIGVGEELTLHYNTEGDGLIPCRCRPGCPYRQWNATPRAASRRPRKAALEEAGDEANPCR